MPDEKSFDNKSPVTIGNLRKQAPSSNIIISIIIAKNKKSNIYNGKEKEQEEKFNKSSFLMHSYI